MADQVGEWLKQLDLGEYAESFAQNKIKFEHLRDLNEDDLNPHFPDELDISCGDRMILL